MSFLNAVLPAELVLRKTDAPVPTMSAISALSLDQRMMRCAELARIARGVIVELGKLYRSIQQDLPAGQTIHALLEAAGVPKGTLGSASYAAKTFDLVAAGLLAEEEYDRMTFQDFLTIARLREPRGDGSETVALKDVVDEFRASKQPAAAIRLEVLTGEDFVPPADAGDRADVSASIQQLQETKTNYHFKLAGLMRAAGEEGVQRALEAAGVEQADVLRASAINALPVQAIRPSLTSDHYLVVMQAKELTERERLTWLGKAEKHRLNPINLRRSIQAGKVVTAEEAARDSGRNSGLDTIEAARFTFDRWLARVKRDDPIDDWPRRRKVMLLEELRPYVDLFNRVKASL